MVAPERRRLPARDYRSARAIAYPNRTTAPAGQPLPRLEPCEPFEG